MRIDIEKFGDDRFIAVTDTECATGADEREAVSRLLDRLSPAPLLSIKDKLNEAIEDADAWVRITGTKAGGERYESRLFQPRGLNGDLIYGFLPTGDYRTFKVPLIEAVEYA